MTIPHDLDLLAAAARRELLVAYLDGELSAEDAVRVAAWLDDHPAALREVEHLRLSWELLGHYEDEPVPADFAQRVFDAVGLAPAAREGRVLRLAWYRRPLATAAAVLVAIGATVFVMSRGADVPPSEPLRTTDVVAVLRDVPPDQLGELLLQADALLSLDAASLAGDYDDESVLGG
ncbi:MAG: hypothetical protein O2894_04585 [Planctomycetota bacterium]|nr:hypothetical protein [Planctomycetota bacterium]